MPTHSLSKEDAIKSLATLEKHKGNITQAAAALGIDRSTMQNRIKRARELHGLTSGSIGEMARETGHDPSNVPFFWDKTDRYSVMVRNPEFRGPGNDPDDPVAAISEAFKSEIPRTKKKKAPGGLAGGPVG